MLSHETADLITVIVVCAPVVLWFWIILWQVFYQHHKGDKK